MTTAQENALNQIEYLAREHFDSSLIVVEADTEDSKGMEFQTSWHGGLSTAIGLSERAKYRLLNQEISTKDHSI